MSESLTMPYSEIRSKLDTFDIVLWSGTGTLSHLIQMGTGSTWSHVGMVIRMPGDLLMLWESTIDTERSGVRLSPLSKSIHGKVAVRLLRGIRTPAMYETLMKVRKFLDGRPFESNWLEFFKAGYDGPFGENTRDLSTLFCAELVAETLQQVGVLNHYTSSNEFTPADFDSRELVVKLCNGFYYDNSILVFNDLPSDKMMPKSIAPIVRPNTRLIAKIFNSKSRGDC